MFSKLVKNVTRTLDPGPDGRIMVKQISRRVWP